MCSGWELFITAENSTDLSPFSTGLSTLFPTIVLDYHFAGGPEVTGHTTEGEMK
jgi:hypothetical protein